MSSCGDGSEKPRKECSKTAEKARDECVEKRDLGYGECTQTRTDRQKQCCDWAPCSWFCDAFWWLVSVVCIAWEWISNVVCVAWHTIKEVVCIAWIVFPVLVCYVVDAVASVFAAIVSVIEAALNWAWSIVGFIVDILLSLPGIGRVLSWLLNAAKTIVNLIISAPDALLTLLGIMPEKKLRLGIIVLRDSRNTPIVQDEQILLRAVQCAINIYRQQLNVRVIPIRYAQYQPAYDSEEVASRDYLFYDDASSSDRLLDLCCETCAFGEDLGAVGAGLNLTMSRHTFWGNGRRLLGYGAPVVAFTTRRYTTLNSGCSLVACNN